ncbi:HAMP domain-containing histidine kinase [Helcobacillus massiliensis]|uniref:sensor histidine kinase n=1 Tax=Helcobacillus massiliensis TaxID=521392 RepID=UPI0021A96C25|nr:HAMP domain-containing sensor histidine kinase [Helcobacillus massiliensis]MCT1557092.1 HAMP domain-containing histidine kinase [Helcobacillus massiliensis]MCT2036173.1 HAMP domain-containing histidine kinase [Helcobacillus massiliensis]MCT2331304.1 HAMP domain-containing histidine kinase [Helcobacillus massiliensis]
MVKHLPTLLRRKHRFTARTRLAFSYALLMFLCGGLLLTLVTLFIGFVPDYGFESVDAQPSQEPLVIAVDDPAVPPDNIKIAVQSQADFITLLLQVSAIALAVLVVLSSVAAWLLAGRMLKPLAAVNQAAKLAADGRLDHRIGLTGPHDEITELAQTFDQMLESIEHSTAARRRFAANASHELRTPLATTRTILDVALSKPGEVDRDVLRKLLQVNERSIRTVESLLDLAELEGGKVKPTSCDMTEIVSTVLRESQPLLAERDLAVTSEFGPATAFGDERLFHQLAQNLIQNAIQHNTDGGSLTVSTRMVAGDDSMAELTVRNTGELIDGAQLSQLTEPFKTTKGRTGGTNSGLGLSIVSAIVDRSNGTLDIAANEGGGLCITVTLPSPDAPA